MDEWMLSMLSISSPMLPGSSAGGATFRWCSIAELRRLPLETKLLIYKEQLSNERRLSSFSEWEASKFALLNLKRLCVLFIIIITNDPSHKRL